MEDNFTFINEDNETEEQRHHSLKEKITFNSEIDKVLKILDKRLPTFILFNNYFKVKPIIHLEHLAQRVEQDILDDEYYDYGNLCLLKLLGFTAHELAEIGNTPSPDRNNKEALQKYRDKLDARS